MDTVTFMEYAEGMLKAAVKRRRAAIKRKQEAANLEAEIEAARDVSYENGYISAYRDIFEKIRKESEA